MLKAVSNYSRTMPGGKLTDSYWFLLNRNFGWHIKLASSAAEARQLCREGIAESEMAVGLSKSAARRSAQIYGVFVVAGGLTYEQAHQLRALWEDNEPAGVAKVVEAGRKYRRSPHWNIVVGGRGGK